MFTITILSPSEPRRNHLFVGLDGQYRLHLVQFYSCTAEILLNGLPHQLLLSVEFIAHIIQSPAMFVITVLSYRKYLPIVFHNKF